MAVLCDYIFCYLIFPLILCAKLAYDASLVDVISILLSHVSFSIVKEKPSFSYKHFCSLYVFFALCCLCFTYFLFFFI